jgi:hypothetical protein
MNLGIEKGQQKGMVMLIAVIMLLAVTLMVMVASNLVQTNLKVVRNMESREQARFSALAAIEEALSSDRFTSTPNNIYTVSCGVANQLCYDINGDGEDDITVLVTAPVCVMVSPTKNSELRPYQYPSEASCWLKDTVYSMCADSVWDFQATATDLVTGAEVVVRQGVSIKTTINKIDTACPL